MPEPLDVVAAALNDRCLHRDKIACGCTPGPIVYHDAHKVLTALDNAGIELTQPTQALDMEVNR